MANDMTLTPCPGSSSVLDPSVQSLLPTPPSNNRLSLRRFSSGRKRSLRPAAEELDDLDSQNDEAEKRTRRMIEEENAKKAENEVLEKDRTRDFKENPFRLAVINMTEQELEEHFAACIRLNNQNKISMKNAFKLHLISVMKRMLDEKSQKTDNFTLMTYSLDAGAKIYSCRVDKLYYDLMKLVKGKDFKRSKEAESDGGSGDEQNQDQENKKEKKKKKKLSEGSDVPSNKMLAQPHQIEKGEVEGELFFKDQTSLPNHLDFFLECPISENGEILLNSKLFPQIDEPAQSKLVTLENKYEGSFSNIDFSTVIPSYINLREKFYVTGSTVEEEDIDDAVVFDPNLISNCEPVDDSHSEYVADYDDPCFGEIEEPPTDVNIPEQSTNVTGPVANISREPSIARQSTGVFSVRKMTQLVSEIPNEYSYFDEAKLAFLGEPSHWSIKKQKSSTVKSEKRITRKKAKKTILLDFADMEMNEIEKKLTKNKKRSDTLSNKKTDTWSSSNVVADSVDNGKINDLLSLFSRDVTLISNLNICTELMNLDVEKMDSQQQGENSDDSDCESNATVISVGVRNDFDDDEILACPLQDSAMEQESEPLELIPAPQKVEQISIQYAKAPKKIDMKLLKSKIWSKIDFNDDKNCENAEEKSCEEERRERNCEKAEEGAKFSKIYTQLPALLTKEDSAALTPHMSFMALLFVANEKGLDVKSTEDSSDLLITKAKEPK